MISILRISPGRHVCTWAMITYRLDDWHKHAWGYTGTITPKGFSASRIEIRPAEGKFIVDGITLKLTGWRVGAVEAVAETDDSVVSGDAWAEAYEERLARWVVGG